MVKRLAKQAGIAKDVHPHMLRHTFATDLLRKTKNLRLAQKALGHAQITSTQIYTHIVDDELEEALKTFRAGSKKR
jgi:integrase/recombinase XerD